MNVQLTETELTRLRLAFYDDLLPSHEAIPLTVKSILQERLAQQREAIANAIERDLGTGYMAHVVDYRDGIEDAARIVREYGDGA